MSNVAFGDFCKIRIVRNVPFCRGFVKFSLKHSAEIFRNQIFETSFGTLHSTMNQCDILQHLMTPSRSKGSGTKKEGLSGGASMATPVRRQLICTVEAKNSPAERM